jgi:hypothetical protein
MYGLKPAPFTEAHANRRAAVVLRVTAARREIPKSSETYRYAGFAMILVADRHKHL